MSLFGNSATKGRKVLFVVRYILQVVQYTRDTEFKIDEDVQNTVVYRTVEMTFTDQNKRGFKHHLSPPIFEHLEQRSK